MLSNMEDFSDTNLSPLFQSNDLDFNQLFKDFDFSSLNESDLLPVSNSSEQSVLDNDIKVKTIHKEMPRPHVEIASKKMPRLHVCNVCDKNFLHRSFLKKHKKTHHKETLCKVCLKTLSSNRSLRRHQKLHTKEIRPTFKCNHCEFAYARKNLLDQHLLKYENCIYTCSKCNEKFCRNSKLKAHIHEQHEQNGKKFDRDEESHKDSFSNVKLHNEKDSSSNVKLHNEKDLSSNVEFNKQKDVFSSVTFQSCEESNTKNFLSSLKSEVENELLIQLNKKKTIKYFVTVEGQVTSSSQLETDESFTLFLDSNIVYIFSQSDIPNYVDICFTEIMHEVSKLERQWTLKKLTRLTVCTLQYSKL